MDTTFESAAEGIRQSGASVEQRELVEILTRHGEDEGVHLERYQRLAQETTSDAIRYLVTLIMEDERRHHTLLADMANTIAWGSTPDPLGVAVPHVLPWNDPDGRFTRETKALLEFELRDQSDLRQLRRRLNPYRDTTLWSLLVDVMLHDTEKHALILRFILAAAKEHDRG